LIQSRLLMQAGLKTRLYIIVKMALIRGEAVEKSVAKRSAQRGLRAAAREMGRIPGIASTASVAVVMPHHRPALSMACPPAAGGFATRDQGAIGITAGEDVVPLRRHDASLLCQRGLNREIDRLAVELFNACGNLNPSRVDPWPAADPVARVDRWCIR
jgi:hypothetical protein